jgi:hypothetical protein
MNLTILKLRSGEEIACQILEENEINVKIFQPMIFKTISSIDTIGRPYDITTLQDWLINSDEKNVNIPINHIAFRSEPNQETIKLYENEQYQFDKEEAKKLIQTDEDVKSDMTQFANFLEDLINSSDLLNNTTPKFPSPKSGSRKKSKKAKNKIKKEEPLPMDMEDESELDRHMIMMQLYIPAEAIMNLITSGIIKPETLLDMIDEVKKRNKFTGDEKKREDFGSKFTDWNPDPKSDDYK